MSRPAFVAAPVAAAVMAPLEAAAGAASVEQLGRERGLAVHAATATVALPGGTLLLVGLGGLDELSVDESFSAALASALTSALGPVTVDVDPAGATATAVLTATGLTITLSRPLVVRLARPAAEMTLSQLRYDIAAAALTLSTSPVVTEVPLLAGQVESLVKELRLRVLRAVRSTALGDPGYSLFRDPAPLATVQNVWAELLSPAPRRGGGLVAAMNRAGAGGFSGVVTEALREARDGLAGSVQDTLQNALPVWPELLLPIGLADVRLQRFALDFAPLAEHVITNRAGTRSLRIRAAQPLQVAADLDIDLSTLVSIAGVAGLSVDAAVAAAPVSALRSVVLSGQVEILSEGVAMAVMSGVRVTPDAVVRLTGLTLTDAARELLNVGGVNLIALERTVGSGIAAGLALVRLVLEAGGGPQAAALIQAAPETALTPALAAAVEGNRSVIIEPAVLAYARQEIEDALTTEVAELLRRHVEEPLGTTLTALLGRPPTVVIP